MTELERKALQLRRERLKRQAKIKTNVQDKAKQFSAEWRSSISVRAVSA